MATATAEQFVYSSDPNQSQTSSNSFASTEGAGSRATATNRADVSQTTSDQQTNNSSSTSSSSSAIAPSSPGGNTVSTTVASPSSDSSSATSSPDDSPVLTIAPLPILISAISFSEDFYQNGKFVKGHKFNDFLKGGRHNDRLQGDRGDDDLVCKSGDDWAIGGRGDDSLRGGQGDDWLAGGKGNDLLIGGLGQDWLTGDGGADRFVLDKGVTALSLCDVITDFNADQGDVIQIASDIANRDKALKNIVFEVFDSDGNGSVDATLIRSGNNTVQAIVLGTVSISGTSTLTHANLAVSA